MENNSLQPLAERLPNGRFAVGNQIPHKPYQRYADRVRLLQEMYSADEIMEIVNDRKRLGKLPVRDSQIFRQLAMTMLPLTEAYTNADVRQERESLLDRLEGKPEQSVDQRIVNVVCLTDADEKSALEALKRYQFKHGVIHGQITDESKK